jgi:battenin
MPERAATCPGRPNNLLGFWLLGLLNNLAYVIMLSAAHDLLQAHHLPSDNSTVHTAFANSSTEGRDCNKVSTGTILLADIAPAVLVKAVAPFLSVRTGIRVVLVAILSGLSFLLAALAPGPGLLYLGVVCASLSSGLGEVTLLAHTHAFPGRAVIAAWSSGTGASGVLGAGSYAALAALGARPRTALLAMLWVPGALLLAFWGLLAPSSSTLPAPEGLEPLLEADGSGEEEAEVPTEAPPVAPLAFAEKLQLTRALLKYMIPLGLVYFFEYLINQVNQVWLNSFYTDSLVRACTSWCTTPAPGWTTARSTAPISSPTSSGS